MKDNTLVMKYHGTDLAYPEDLPLEGDSFEAWKVVIDLMHKDGYSAEDTGGCKVFYSPKRWQERGENYGTSSKLIIVHDGGAHEYYFNGYDYTQLEKQMVAFSKTDLYVEQCTGWYSAVYRA